MMQSDVLKSPRLCAMHASPARTKLERQGQSIARQGELGPKGHNHTNCPLAQCDACNLSGHIADVCTFRQCYDVEVDHLNLLLLTKGRTTIESYFDANGEACIHPNALRIHGKFTESIDWDDVKQRFAITAASSRTQEHRTRFQADHDTRIKSCATRSEPSIKRANSLRISGISGGSERHH
jgi:hypothetical protein